MSHAATFGLAVSDGGVVRTVLRAALFAGAASVILEERPRAPAPATRPSGPLVSVAAHSAATAKRAQRARYAECWTMRSRLRVLLPSTCQNEGYLS